MPVVQIIPRSPVRSVSSGHSDVTAFTAWWSDARRAFDVWRGRQHTRAALANMTARELADIGMTTCDRAMTLARHNWADPDSSRNITTS
jgi:uncharacterized protein YjiS (DUF1127 family)